MQVQLIEVLGTDLTVVNAARVSFNKHHEQFETKDEKLIAYLAKHGHWTPFGHPQLQFRVHAPIFVARQLVKHQVGLVWNEVSRRYVDSKPSFYITNAWRRRAENKKQGSGDELVELTGNDYDFIQAANAASVEAYSHLLSKGVAPEQARMVLPQSMYTEWYWTGSLYAFARVCKLRLSPDAQLETKEVAEKIAQAAERSFPISWFYLLSEKG